MDRRTFAQTLGSAVIGASALPGLPMTAGHRVEKIRRVGLQLYTVRGDMRRDFDGTLAQVADAGYKEVEFAGYFGRTPEQVKAALEANKLTAPSSHIDLKSLEDTWATIRPAARTMGHQWVTVAWIDQNDRRTLADWSRVAQRFNAVGKLAKDAGLRFAYHNHEFEFTPIEGKVGYDVLLAETDPDLVQFEMDLFWIVKGGSDPLAYFARYPGRFPMVHVKDMADDGRQTMMDVGKGTIDFKKIFAKSKQAGIQHYFVEHDQPGVALESIRASYDHLSKLEF